jgi:hypothetical protein
MNIQTYKYMKYNIIEHFSFLPSVTKQKIATQKTSSCILSLLCVSKLWIIVGKNISVLLFQLFLTRENLFTHSLLFVHFHHYLVYHQPYIIVQNGWKLCSQWSYSYCICHFVRYQSYLNFAPLSCNTYKKNSFIQII